MSEQKLIEELAVGDYVIEGYNAKRQLLVSNFPIHEEGDLRRLRDIGVKRCSVQAGEVRTETGDDSSESTTEDETETPVVEQARATYHDTLAAMHDLVEPIHDNRNHAQDLKELKPFIADFIDYIQELPEGVSCLTQIQQFDDFTYHHSVNVSLLALLYGHAQGFERNLLQKFGFGALVHDIGKTKLARRILRQDRELSEKERTIVEKHPEKGRDILRRAGFSEAVQKIALQHHHRYDGSGYPSNTGEIYPLAQITAVIDVYEHLLAVGPDRSRPHPVEAYTRLKDEFYEFRETRVIVENLIHLMGLYPVGCLVELSTDDIAVVLENNTDHLRYPQVSVVGSRDRGAVEDPYEIDLEHIQYQKRAAEGKIYDDSTRIERVLNYQDAPDLRRKAPEVITDHHAA